MTFSVWPASLSGPRLSLASTSNVTEPSSATVAVSALAVGASFTSVTVTETVAGAESTEPSLATNVKLSGPKSSPFGV